MNEIKQNLKQGFTLFELLVAVLIIGVLAGIALPQYRRAKTKAEASQLYEEVSSMAKAVQISYMINGDWPSKFDQLDIEYKLPIVNSSVCGSDAINGGIMRNNKYEFILGKSASFSHISARFASGPYKCTGFIIFLKHISRSSDENRFLCWEKLPTSASRGSKNKKGDFCEKVMGYKFYNESSGDSNFFTE